MSYNTYVCFYSGCLLFTQGYPISSSFSLNYIDSVSLRAGDSVVFTRNTSMSSLLSSSVLLNCFSVRN